MTSDQLPIYSKWLLGFSNGWGSGKQETHLSSALFKREMEAEVKILTHLNIRRVMVKRNDILQKTQAENMIIFLQ